jgi:beta-glucanase (GH16 family)
MDKSIIHFFAVFLVISLMGGCVATQSSDSGKKQLRLVWSDEFNYTGLPDTVKWGYDPGDGCPTNCSWGNNELQHYSVHRKENARVENGRLVIEARREKSGTREYSSARMVSRHKGDWTYGRVTVRAKLPKGKGVWPAIWMLPTDWAYGGWPESGEIDIMEHVGYMPDSVFGSVHTKRFNHVQGTQVTAGLRSTTLSSEFHEYSIEWDAEKIDFFFDNQKYQTFHNKHEGAGAWPFDRDFHLILNIAVGGNWGGKMGVDTAIWPQQMVVDYVRVYQ